MTLAALEDVSKSYEDRVLLAGISLSIADGERVGLVGPNGGGKSTLLRILAGLEAPDAGRRVLRRDLALGYLEQEPALDPGITVRAAARVGLGERARLLDQLDALHARLAEAGGAELDPLLGRQARLETELEALGGYDVEHRIEATLQSLGLTDFDARCGTLSGGERRRVALARLLLGEPELLLLDEPTNHLDAFVTDWLEDWFLETRTPLLLVTHDRYFLDRVVDRIVELDRGKLFSYPGGYGDYLEARAARLAAEGRAEGARLNLLRRETAWMRRGPPARTTKAKARIQRYRDLEAGGTEALPAELDFALPPGPRLGARVVALRGVTKGFGGRVVVPPLDLELQPGTRLGIVGPNGAGKTTLVRLLTGELAPDGGTVEIGETVRFMGVDQLRAELDPARTVAEELAGKGDVVRVGERTVRVEAFLERFGFPPRGERAAVGQLSGGERGRLLLAKLLTAGGNVLVLDEPTNDLDLSTLRSLEEALLLFPGSVVIVSHDRWFLDRVTTLLLFLDGKGHARLHHGDFSSLLERLAAERAAAPAPREAPRPARAPSAPAPPPKAKRLTPWQEAELAELLERIAALEGELSELDERLSDPELYAGPHEAAAAIQDARGARQAELDRLYARWEELEGERAP